LGDFEGRPLLFDIVTKDADFSELGLLSDDPNTGILTLF
jgi:hypothetical protein